MNLKRANGSNDWIGWSQTQDYVMQIKSSGIDMGKTTFHLTSNVTGRKSVRTIPLEWRTRKHLLSQIRRPRQVLRMAATNLRECDTYFRGAVPPISDSAGASGGGQGDGRQTRPAPLPHAMLRNEICGPRRRVI